MSKWIAGVDGCKGGWVAAFRDLTRPNHVEVRVEPTLEAITDADEQPEVVAVDMPIGLPDRVGAGGRSAEQIVRKLLRGLRNAVFPTSARSVVYAPNYTAAIALARSSNVQPFAPSPPANAIFPRIRQIDGLLRRRPELVQRVFEVHPEVVFWTMNGEEPLSESKRSIAGLNLRRRLLRQAGLPEEVVAAVAPPRAQHDDVLDALAALVVAKNLANKLGRSFPDPPEVDAHGLPVAIWTYRKPDQQRFKVRISPSSLPISPGDIRAAYARIASHIRRTPVWNLPRGFGHDGPVSLKLELLQHAGSFKPRGAFNALLSQPIPKAGVAAASGGNHGAAVAYAAKQLALKARIFVPEIAAPAKIAVLRSQGAEVVIGGARYADAQDACDRHVAGSGALRVHPFDADATITGQGTVALEWEEDAPDLDTVLVAVGGGGLIAGVASWWAGRVKVVGVEPEGSRALHAALEAGGPVDVTVESLAADSLGARNSDAQRALWRDWRMATEPGGAAALAALVSGAYKPRSGERVGVLLCGANVDLAKLAELAA